MAKKKLGKILIIPKGDYDAAVLYRRLDLVKYNGTSYLCKKDNTIGIEPTNIERWYKVVDAVGDMDIFFEEVSKRENISSSDPLSLILGKIKKWFDDLKPVAFSGKYKDLVDTPQNATISVAGLMSEKDKKKLDDITESADSVSYSASLTNGTKVGTIRINGEDYELYAPTNTDTKNTAGAKDSTQKLYLIGATSQANAPQTYSQDTAYVGTDGCIYSNNKKTITIGEVSRSAAITVQGNYALDAIEKNASIEGTLAYLISSQNTVLTNSINQLNSNLANKLKIVTILGINTYSTNVEYTPTNKANIFTYYIPILVWRQGAVVAKQGYDNTYDIVTADIPSVDSSICVIRHATFLINKTTGAIKIEKLNQANLQSDGNYIFSTDTMEIGLLGISL